VSSITGEAVAVAVAIAVDVAAEDCDAGVQIVGVEMVLVVSKISVGIGIVLVAWNASVGMVMLGTSVVTFPLLFGGGNRVIAIDISVAA
jgi:hypothetical protein